MLGTSQLQDSSKIRMYDGQSLPTSKDLEENIYYKVDKNLFNKAKEIYDRYNNQ